MFCYKFSDEEADYVEVKDATSKIGKNRSTFVSITHVRQLSDKHPTEYYYLTFNLAEEIRKMLPFEFQMMVMKIRGNAMMSIMKKEQQSEAELSRKV